MHPILPIFILALPVACIAWTVTHEEVFREFHEYCEGRYIRARSMFSKKFFYLFTCEYCFSHYVTIAILLIFPYTLLTDGWRGYVLAGFAIVWIANIYMSLFGLIRVDMKKIRKEAEE